MTKSRFTAFTPSVLVVLALLPCLDRPAAAEASGEEPGGWSLMFQRDFRRPMVRGGYWSLLEDLERADGKLAQLAVTLVGQLADQSLTGRDGLVNLDYDFAGAWRFYRSPGEGEGILSWWVDGGLPVGAPRDSDLSKDIGSGFGLNQTLENRPLYLHMLYWEQLFRGGFTVAAGRMDASWRYDQNAVANNHWEDFLAEPLVNTKGVPFPEPGLDLELGWKPNDLLWLHAGVCQDNTDTATSNLGRVNDDDLLWLAEMVLSPEWGGRQGNYRFLAWHRETEGRSGSGFSVNIDQETGGGITVFLRYSDGDTAVTPFERFASLGFGWDEPFGRQGERFGLGWVRGDPSDNTRREEELFEAFYRVQINDFLTITPDLQLVLDPAQNPSHDKIWVLGLRIQGVF